jgi:hypothetical protein
VELLFLAVQQGVPVVEVPVQWQEIDGSKVRGVGVCKLPPSSPVTAATHWHPRPRREPSRESQCCSDSALWRPPLSPICFVVVAVAQVDMIADTLNMARDLIVTRLCYLVGFWTFVKASKSK